MRDFLEEVPRSRKQLIRFGASFDRARFHAIGTTGNKIVSEVG